MELPFVTYNTELLAIVAPQLEAELVEQLSRKTFSEQAKAILKHLVAGQRPGIVLNEALMKLRKQRTSREESLDIDFSSESDALPRDLADWSPNPQELYGEVELREILIKCLGSLHPALRVVFVLRDIEELSISETCEALSLSAAAVKTRLFRARLQLRETLTGYFRKTPWAALRHRFSRARLAIRRTESLRNG